MVPAALRRTAPRPTTRRLVSVRAAADRALTAPMPSVPVPRMADAARVASAVATKPAGKVTAPTTAALAVSTAHRAGVAARVVRMLPVANSVVITSAARTTSPNWPREAPTAARSAAVAGFGWSSVTMAQPARAAMPAVTTTAASRLP
jgi:hypothetical protein